MLAASATFVDAVSDITYTARSVRETATRPFRARTVALPPPGPRRTPIFVPPDRLACSRGVPRHVQETTIRATLGVRLFVRLTTVECGAGSEDRGRVGGDWERHAPVREEDEEEEGEGRALCLRAGEPRRAGRRHVLLVMGYVGVGHQLGKRSHHLLGSAKKPIS